MVSGPVFSIAPPPETPLRLCVVLPENVLSLTRTMPLLAMPPPPSRALLALSALLITTTCEVLKALSMAPP